jgi:hypothetical protein
VDKRAIRPGRLNVTDRLEDTISDALHDSDRRLFQEYAENIRWHHHRDAWDAENTGVPFIQLRISITPVRPHDKIDAFAKP